MLSTSPLPEPWVSAAEVRTERVADAVRIAALRGAMVRLSGARFARHLLQAIVPSRPGHLPDQRRGERMPIRTLFFFLVSSNIRNGAPSSGRFGSAVTREARVTGWH